MTLLKLIDKSQKSALYADLLSVISPRGGGGLLASSGTGSAARSRRAYRRRASRFHLAGGRTVYLPVSCQSSAKSSAKHAAHAAGLFLDGPVRRACILSSFTRFPQICHSFKVYKLSPTHTQICALEGWPFAFQPPHLRHLVHNPCITKRGVKQ